MSLPPHFISDLCFYCQWLHSLNLNLDYWHIFINYNLQQKSYKHIFTKQERVNKATNFFKINPSVCCFQLCSSVQPVADIKNWQAPTEVPVGLLV